MQRVLFQVNCTTAVQTQPSAAPGQMHIPKLHAAVCCMAHVVPDIDFGTKVPLVVFYP